jgi:hypothetical protein
LIHKISTTQANFHLVDASKLKKETGINQLDLGYSVKKIHQDQAIIKKLNQNIG